MESKTSFVRNKIIGLKASGVVGTIEVIETVEGNVFVDCAVII